MPEKIQPSNKTVVATQFGPACPQPDMDRLKTSEDCLFVNVWVPEVGFLSTFLFPFSSPFSIL
jgi:carboxylesterase type B